MRWSELANQIALERCYFSLQDRQRPVLLAFLTANRRRFWLAAELGRPSSGLRWNSDAQPFLAFLSRRQRCFSGFRTHPAQYLVYIRY
jgi:hypothetical protein